MESSMFKEKIICEKHEFMWRLFSSFLFVLMVVFLFQVPPKAFTILCWGTYAIMVYEIFSSSIKGKMLLRICAAIVCFGGIRSFLSFDRDQCILLIWLSSLADIGAYSFGKILQGPKLCPKISPKKTWAGFWGGILLPSLAFFYLDGIVYRLDKMHFMAFWVAGLVVLASVAGDLLESWFKRTIGVKDMGNLFPGHGGILDRLDSLLFASMALAIINIWRN
jgi:CDP-diglyceride synthetase